MPGHPPSLLCLPLEMVTDGRKSLCRPTSSSSLANHSSTRFLVSTLPLYHLGHYISPPIPTPLTPRWQCVLTRGADCDEERGCIPDDPDLRLGEAEVETGDDLVKEGVGRDSSEIPLKSRQHKQLPLLPGRGGGGRGGGE